MTFQYGYFYAQMMTIFAIILIYSTTVPIITLMGALYIFLKHGVDSFNILTMHRKELESKSEMLDNVLFASHLILILYQCCILVFFSMNEMNVPAFFVVLTIIVTVIIWKRTSDDVFEEERIPALMMAERANKSLELKDEYVSKWRKEYSHPLLLISASHHAQAYGVEILRRDNWQEFMDDNEINEFLRKIEDDDRGTHEGRRSVFGQSMVRHDSLIRRESMLRENSKLREEVKSRQRADDSRSKPDESVSRADESRSKVDESKDQEGPCKEPEQLNGKAEEDKDLETPQQNTPVEEYRPFEVHENAEHNNVEPYRQSSVGANSMEKFSQNNPHSNISP